MSLPFLQNPANLTLRDVRLDDVVGERLVGGLRRVHRVEEHELRRRPALRQRAGAQRPHRQQTVPAAALARLGETCNARSKDESAGAQAQSI